MSFNAIRENKILANFSEFTVPISINPYTANSFCPENVVCLLRLLHILKLPQSDFNMEVITMIPVFQREQSDLNPYLFIII